MPLEASEALLSVGAEAELFQLKCGREADLFCEIGTCFPGTWYCQFHYKMKHVEFECPHLDEGPCFCPTHDYASCSVDRVNEFENEFDDEKWDENPPRFTEIPWDYEKEEWLEEMDGYIHEFEEYRRDYG